MKYRLKSLLLNRQGNVAVEFAFVGPILFVILFGLIESGRLYFIRNDMQYAADEAARYAIVNTFASNETISQHLKDHLAVVDPEQVSVIVLDQTISGRTYKQISLDYTFSSAVGGLINLDNVPINIQSTVPVLP